MAGWVLMVSNSASVGQVGGKFGSPWPNAGRLFVSFLSARTAWHDGLLLAAGGRWKTLPAVPSAVIPGAVPFGTCPFFSLSQTVDGIFGARPCAVVDRFAEDG